MTDPSLVKNNPQYQILKQFVDDVAEMDCAYGQWNGVSGSCETMPRAGTCIGCRARATLKELARLEKNSNE